VSGSLWCSWHSTIAASTWRFCRERLPLTWAPGLPPRSVFDGRKLPPERYAEPEKDLKLLLAKFKLVLPEQHPPRITPEGAV
jgi:hypothetical protein